MKIGNVNKKMLLKNYEDALKSPSFKRLVKHLDISDEEGVKLTSKLESTIEELEVCTHCKGIYDCKNSYKGHVLTPVRDEVNNLVFTYIPCKYLKKELELKNKKVSEKEINSTARMKDIDYKDKKRIEVIKWLDKFYDDFSFSKKMKGLYLHGNFGSGKTFLISALLNELSNKKNVTTEIVYYPELIKDLKTDWDSYGDKTRYYETVDILCLDDIGAEKVSSWSRDEVLGTILQSRMNNNLVTFFTSNLSLTELEKHFSQSDDGIDKVNARRIMERIKQLSEPMEMISENKRK